MHCARLSSDWLMVREQSGVSGILIINLWFRLSEVYITVVSMLPTSSTLGVVVGACLCLADQLKDMLQIVMHILGEGTRTLFSHRTTVYHHSSPLLTFVSECPHFPSSPFFL